MPAPEAARSLRSASWRISVALLFCLGVVSAGLHSVLQGVGWWFAIFGVVLAVLGSAAVARAASRRRWLPTLVSSLVLLLVLTVFFAGRTAFLFAIPTPGTLARFDELGRAGAVSIGAQSVPAEVTFGVAYLLCLGVGAIAIAADLIAVTWRRPALAGIPLAVVLGIPAFVGLELTDLFVFLLAAISWLVLLRAGQPLRQTGRSIGLGAVALLVALVTPLILPPVEGSRAAGDRFGGYLAGVNPVLNLGEELRRQVPRSVLFYSTRSDDPQYLRLVSLQNFTAETWAPDEPQLDTDNTPQRVGPPPGLSSEVAIEPETTWVDVGNLGSPWLPVPYPATGVAGLRGSWYWDAEDLTFTSPSHVARGESYRVSSLGVGPTPAQLTSAVAPRAEDFARYLELPDGLPAAIADTAAVVTEGASSDYGKAVALQEYFRDGAFEYSETAPIDEGYDGTGMEMIAQFLQARSGYCVHFASAMAVMARTLGIPSRVAVGFLPGADSGDEVQGRTSYRVTTQDLHSWPELYFSGIGWTRFEPTPGRGFVPVYADEANPGVPVPPALPSTEPTSPAATPTPTPTGPAVPLDPDDPRAAGGGAEGMPGWAWPALLLLGALLVLLLPAVVRALQRGIRLRRLSRGWPMGTTGWRELLQSAQDLGTSIEGTATPRAAAHAILRAARLADADAGVLREALAVLERQSFARPGIQASGAEQAGQIRRVLARLRSAAGVRARLFAAVAPRSTWARLLGFAGMPAAARTAMVTRVG